MPSYYRPNGTRYRPGQRGCLADGCASRLLVILLLCAFLLILALNFHPQGFPLIPWLLNRLPWHS
jgi:hypothetical protein